MLDPLFIASHLCCFYCIELSNCLKNNIQNNLTTGRGGGGVRGMGEYIRLRCTINCKLWRLGAVDTIHF